MTWKLVWIKGGHIQKVKEFKHKEQALYYAKRYRIDGRYDWYVIAVEGKE
jgi:hypothetical protein